jgi:hypothetical protein
MRRRGVLAALCCFGGVIVDAVGIIGIVSVVSLAVVCVIGRSISIDSRCGYAAAPLSRTGQCLVQTMEVTPHQCCSNGVLC